MVPELKGTVWHNTRPHPHNKLLYYKNIFWMLYYKTNGWESQCCALNNDTKSIYIVFWFRIRTFLAGYWFLAAKIDILVKFLMYGTVQYQWSESIEIHKKVHKKVS
jgi:hypothetical protein